jgi:hypothetical protein
MARSRSKGELGMERAVLWAGIANNLVGIRTTMAHRRR